MRHRGKQTRALILVEHDRPVRVDQHVFAEDGRELGDGVCPHAGVAFLGGRLPGGQGCDSWDGRGVTLRVSSGLVFEQLPQAGGLPVDGAGCGELLAAPALVLGDAHAGTWTPSAAR